MTEPTLSGGAGHLTDPAAPRAMRPGEAHVWALRVPPDDDGPLPLATRELGPVETRRAAAFRRPRDRLTYTAAHIALRRLLSAYTGIPPGRLRLGRAPCPRCAGEHGPPVLSGTGPHFSLSHSHGLAVVGLAGTPLGVDVQRLPTVASAQVCLPALHPAERREMAALPGEQLPAAFGELWVRKEAYLKGLGTGLCRRAAADYLGAGGPGAPGRPEGWSVRNLPVEDGHVAATAVRADAPHRTVARHLPEEWLYAEDATDLIAAVRARH
ncbi:4'-phosphopantetheinyl transferase superfamily protein [Streptomyces sp. ISL-98]|uniref:4'-phosphopantetheinyl transferase family protein n=1 Tax=Streptomyces sp. ISL-98 TaxID=2819192 RepID=UPI001BE98B4F|nr:4'-phosphopantetheinyl transferase superfamily protein [Streptomyces sp. ISL-98]MBT2507441.1 4'-phosphopantetheinyl transferase superfamily protein [Streptomyces sp. ISL-98]